MKHLGNFIAAIILAGMAFVGAANAAEPQPWQLNLQPAASDLMADIHEFHWMLLVIITAITIVVLALLLWTMFRYRESANPNPSKTTHNTMIEVIWTVVPVLILIVIAVPSFRLIYAEDKIIESADMTVKAIGFQWAWAYEYPDHGNFTFESYMIPEEDLQPGQKRLLDTDNVVVLPVETNIRLLVTARDVLHSFAMPALGVKKDGVPGRLNETAFRIREEYAGQMLYGQCSEICGTGHAYMPIAIKAVTKAEFEEWVRKAQQEFARVDGTPAPQLADRSAQ